MAKEITARHGRKRPQLIIAVERLHLDTLNPRLPESVIGKSENEVLKVLYEEFGLGEIAISMSNNGYFDEEPLVAVPDGIPRKIIANEPVLDNPEYIKYLENEKTSFTIAEGNRRLATVKILLDDELRGKLSIRSWPKLTEKVRKDLLVLPVIVYPNREEVIPYLGVRHISGIKKWDSYAKARYIASMLDSGRSAEEIEHQIGDKQGSIRKNTICYKMLKQARDEFDYDTESAKEDFSFLILSIGQGNIKRYLGLSHKVKEIPLEDPIQPDKLGALKNLLSWLFGEGKSVKRVIAESRDITKYLSHVVASTDAVDYLDKHRNLEDAFDLSSGEETMLKKDLASANRKLEKTLGIAHRHKTVDVIQEAKKCFETSERVYKTVTE